MKLTPYQQRIKRDRIRAAVRLLLRTWDAVRAAEKIHGADISMDIIDQLAVGIDSPRDAMKITDKTIDALLSQSPSK